MNIDAGLLETIKRWRGLSAIRYIFLLIAVLLIGLYLHRHWHEIRSLPVPRFSWLFIHIISIPLLFAVNGLIQFSVLRHFGVNIPYRECFGLSVMNSFMNYAVPFQGGIGFRSIYLKTKYNFKISLFLSLLTVVNIVNCFLNAALGLGLTIWFRNRLQTHHFNLLAGIFLVVLALILVISVLIPFIPQFNWRFFRWINRWKEGWTSLRNNRILILKLVGLAMFNVCISAIVLFTVFRAISFPVTIKESVFLNSLISFSLFFNLTPGAIGVSEGITAFGVSVLGYKASIGLVASIICRLFNLLWVFTLGGILGFSMFRAEPRNSGEGEDQ